MRILAALLAILAAAPAVAVERPLVVVGVGVGLDLEPSRPVGTAEVRPSLAAFAFEGELLGRSLGLLLRGVATDGTSDYTATGFDRIGFSLAGSWRPLATLVGGYGYGSRVARRLAFEAGFLFQELLAAYHSAHTAGLHLGFHADFPLLQRADEGGLLLRLVVQRPFILTSNRLQSDVRSSPAEVGEPFQFLVTLGLGF